MPNAQTAGWRYGSRGVLLGLRNNSHGAQRRRSAAYPKVTHTCSYNGCKCIIHAFPGTEVSPSCPRAGVF